MYPQVSHQASYPADGDLALQQAQQQVFLETVYQKVRSYPPEVQGYFQQLLDAGNPPGEALTIATREGKKHGYITDFHQPLTEKQKLLALEHLTGFQKRDTVSDSYPIISHVHVIPNLGIGEVVPLNLQYQDFNQERVLFYFCPVCSKLILVKES